MSTGHEQRADHWISATDCTKRRPDAGVHYEEVTFSDEGSVKRGKRLPARRRQRRADAGAGRRFTAACTRSGRRSRPRDGRLVVRLVVLCDTLADARAKSGGAALRHQSHPRRRPRRARGRRRCRPSRSRAPCP
jgi:hypothetical protein